MTVFEKDSRIGGRIDSIFPYIDHITPADIGAYTFDADDIILANMFESIDEFRPRRYPLHWSGIWTEDQLDRISLWDGESLSTSAMEAIPFSWTNAANIIMKHAFRPTFWSNFARFCEIAFSDVDFNGWFPEDFIEDEVGVYYAPSYVFRRPNLLDRWKDVAREYVIKVFWVASRARFGPPKEVLRDLSETYGFSPRKQNTTVHSMGYGTGLNVVLK